MSNPQAGELLYTVLKLWVAQLDPTTNTFGVPVQIDYVQDTELAGEYDTDTIKAGGMNRELLTVQIGSTLKFSEAWMPTAAITAITNETESESGSSGSRVWERIISGAGGGLPYVGLVGQVAGINNAFGIFAAPKCKANKKPDAKYEQNKFRVSEMEFMMASATPAVNKLVKTERYERLNEIPDFTDQATFQSYMDEMFS